MTDKNMAAVVGYLATHAFAESKHREAKAHRFYTKHKTASAVAKKKRKAQQAKKSRRRNRK